MTRSVRANICDLCPIVVILPELERDGLSGKLESMRVPECEGVHCCKSRRRVTVRNLRGGAVSPNFPQMETRQRVSHSTLAKVPSRWRCAFFTRIFI